MKTPDLIERAPGVAVGTAQEGPDLVVYVRLVVSKTPQPSKSSGKTMILASTRGAVSIPVAGDVARLSVNLYR